MIILLDIDGVMVPAVSWKMPELLKDGFPNFSVKAVNSLNRIIYTTKATIILTTSHKSKYPIASWRQIFAQRGINAKIYKMRSTSTPGTRKEEVLRWIHKYPSMYDFVIIDDDKSLNDLS